MFIVQIHATWSRGHDALMALRNLTQAIVAILPLDLL